MKKQILVLPLLLGTCFALPHWPHRPPVIVKPTESVTKPGAIPEIPIGYRDKFKTLVIKQRDVQIDKLNLQLRFNEDTEIAKQIDTQGTVLETQLMKDLKLDATKFTVLYKEDEIRIVGR